MENIGLLFGGEDSLTKILNNPEALSKIKTRIYWESPLGVQKTAFGATGTIKIVQPSTLSSAYELPKKLKDIEAEDEDDLSTIDLFVALVVPCSISIVMFLLAYLFCGEKIKKRKREFESMEMTDIASPPESGEINTEDSDKEFYPTKEEKIIS